MQGVKGSSHWAQVACPECDAPLFDRCIRPTGSKASHPHRLRLIAAGNIKPRTPLPGYEVEFVDEKQVLIVYEDSLLPIDTERAAKAALRAVRKAFGEAFTVRQSDARPPIDWATAKPRGQMFQAVLR